MQLDERAINFIQNAKAQGFSKEQVAQFLQDKGYDMGLGSNTPQQVQTQTETQVQETKDPYSALDKAKYATRSAIEGATFGLGDMVAGLTNIPANYLAGNFQNPVKLFKEGRKDFVNEQNAFSEEHPALNFGGEIVGGLFTGGAGAGRNVLKTGVKQGIKQLAKTGAKEGAKFGAAYGAGSGLTSDADKLSVANALLGAGTGGLGGAVLGAAIPLGISAVGKGASKIANYFPNKTINTLKGANKELVEQSIKEGKPLLDIADSQLMDVAEGANLLNREAKQTFADYGKARVEGQHPKLVEILGKYFDPRGSHELLDNLNEDILKGSKYLYDKAVYQMDNKGNILLDKTGRQVSKVLPELEKLNKYELDYVSKVYGTKGLEYEVQGLPQNDMRILNYAKQLMDDDIQTLINKGHNNQARILAEKRAQFIDKIDKANPEYKTARNFYERGKKAENALQAGKAALAGERENLSYDYNKLSPEEKFFFRQGVGNRLEELSNQNAEGGNIFKRVFGAETRRRLSGLDIPRYSDLEKLALAESKAASNINKLGGGSPTADRLEAIKRFTLGVIRRPTRTITNVLANTAFKPFYANPAEVAKAMTDPKFLTSLYLRQQNKTVAPSLPISTILQRTNAYTNPTAAITANKIAKILEENNKERK